MNTGETFCLFLGVSENNTAFCFGYADFVGYESVPDDIYPNLATPLPMKASREVILDKVQRKFVVQKSGDVIWEAECWYYDMEAARRYFDKWEGSVMQLSIAEARAMQRDITTPQEETSDKVGDYMVGLYRKADFQLGGKILYEKAVEATHSPLMEELKEIDRKHFKDNKEEMYIHVGWAIDRAKTAIDAISGLRDQLLIIKNNCEMIDLLERVSKK